MNNDSKVMVKKTTIPCSNPRCKDFSRENSRFCSHKCGVSYHYNQLLKEKIDEMLQKKQNQEDQETQILSNIKKIYADGAVRSISDMEDLKMIDQINSEKEILMREKEAFTLEKELFEKEVQKIHEIKPSEYDTDDSNLKKEKKYTDVIDCISCGHPVTSQTYILHNEQCFIKTENNYIIEGATKTLDDGNSLIYCDYYYAKKNSYCKKLKASCTLHSEFWKHRKTGENLEICGYIDRSGIRCEIRKKECLKHLNWENIKRAKIQLKDITQEQTLNSLNTEESMIEDRIKNRYIIWERNHNKNSTIEEEEEIKL